MDERQHRQRLPLTNPWSPRRLLALCRSKGLNPRLTAGLAAGSVRALRLRCASSVPLFALALVLVAPAARAQKCVTCWSDSCPELESYTSPCGGECPDGKATGPETAGHCCWPEQVWSKAKTSCVGAPACPAGLVARGNGCEKRVEAPPATPEGTAKAEAAAEVGPTARDGEAMKLLNAGTSKTTKPGDPAGAAADFKKCVALKPRREILSHCLRNLGVMQARKGDTAGAVQTFTKYLPYCGADCEQVKALIARWGG